MTRGHPIKYTPAVQQQQRRSYPPYLCPVPSQPSQAVSAEAGEVFALMEKVAASMRMTETLGHTSPVYLQDEWPVPYDHVEAKHVRTIKARYRNIGRLPPREITFDDE
jgi:hypothetical protein